MVVKVEARCGKTEVKVRLELELSPARRTCFTKEEIEAGVQFGLADDQPVGALPPEEATEVVFGPCGTRMACTAWEGVVQSDVDL